MRPLSGMSLRPWAGLFIVALSAGAVVLLLGQWLVTSQAMSWLETYATFRGAPDLLQNLRDFGPTSLASLVMASVVVPTSTMPCAS